MLHHQLPAQGEYAIWDIKESEAYFRSLLELAPTEQEEVDRIKGEGRRIEWLSSRYLLHLMSGRMQRGVLIKDEFGKPHLQHSSFQISLSHSNDRCAVIAAPYTIGIDIQKIVSKIERIAHKFMRPEEIESLVNETQLTQLHIYWGAKEALYKAYGKKELDFRKHIKVTPIYSIDEKGETTASIEKEQYQQSFRVRYERVGDYILVMAAELPIGF